MCCWLPADEVKAAVPGLSVRYISVLDHPSVSIRESLLDAATFNHEARLTGRADRKGVIAVSSRQTRERLLFLMGRITRPIITMMMK